MISHFMCSPQIYLIEILKRTRYHFEQKKNVSYLISFFFIISLQCEQQQNVMITLVIKKKNMLYYYTRSKQASKRMNVQKTAIKCRQKPSFRF